MRSYLSSTVVLLPFFTSLAMRVQAQASFPVPLPVTIIMTNLPSPTAPLKLNFYSSAASFLQPGQATQHVATLPQQQFQAQVQVQLSPGEWAIALSQDTNYNGKMDRNFLGLPVEPYAFSNNVRPHFKAPSFAECKFLVVKPGQVITIRFPD